MCARTDPYRCFNISIIPPRAAQSPLATLPSARGSHRTGRGEGGGSSPAAPAGRAAAAPPLLLCRPRALPPGGFALLPLRQVLIPGGGAGRLCQPAGALPLPQLRPGAARRRVPPAASLRGSDGGRDARKVGRGARVGGGTCVSLCACVCVPPRRLPRLAAGVGAAAAAGGARTREPSWPRRWAAAPGLRSVPRSVPPPPCGCEGGEEPVPGGRRGEERRAEAGAAGEREEKGPPSVVGSHQIPPLLGVTGDSETPWSLPVAPSCWLPELNVSCLRGENGTLCQPSERTARGASNALP